MSAARLKDRLPLTPVSLGLPAGVLVIEPNNAAADALQALVARASENTAWVFHESSLGVATKLLAACHFRLILLNPVLPDAPSPGAALRAVKQAAPTSALVLVLGRGSTLPEMEREALGPQAARLAGAVAVLLRDQEDVLTRVIRHVLGLSPEPE